MSARCECGLSYVHGSPEDEELHAKIHDEYACGPIIEALTSLPAEVVDGYRVVWIDPAVPKIIRKAAATVAYIECRELHRPVSYDGSDTDEEAAFGSRPA